MLLIKHWFTEKDNQTWDLAKAMGAYAFVHYHAMNSWNVYHGVVFNPQEYATGLGILLTTLGVLLGLKKDA